MKVPIKHIDDVLPYISAENGICVAKRENYTVIDYSYVLKETFDSDIALQCRGLKFDASGGLIARPFHKFFNMCEREDPLQMDWSRSHVILDKLDGTMVHAAFLEGELVFMTRMGLTRHAETAFKVADQNVLKLCKDLLIAGITPMFEYTSPDNRVVIAYEKTALTLLAARETFSGYYLPHDEIMALCRKYDVPSVATFGCVEDIKSFMEDGRQLEGVEGYVIAFDDGHRVKLKADGYVLRHRALSHATMEKNVLAWVLTNAIDDVIPILPEDIAAHVLDYQAQVEKVIAKHIALIEAFIDEFGEEDRKTFALATARLPKQLRSAAFSLLDGKSAREAVLGHLNWTVHSQPRIDKERSFYGFEWPFNLDEIGEL